MWGAAFRQNNLLGQMFRPAKQFEPVDGYNPYVDKNELHGYEQWGSAFADSRSPEETAWLKQQIDDENEDRRVLSEAGGGSRQHCRRGCRPGYSGFDVYPRRSGGAVARIASQAAIGAAATAASEVALNNQQITRTWGKALPTSPPVR